MPASLDSREVFVERQWPSFGAWLLAPGGGLFAGLAVFPLSDVAAVAVLLAVTLTIAIVLARTAERVTVTDGTDPGLRAGRAFLEAWHVGEVTELDREASRRALGPGSDARAYLAHRGWIRTAVRVRVLDPQDPTPYWLISTRRPAELAAALVSVRPPTA
ncbi:DUF3093 domain-containing protein [Serinibacter arcticus]|uniref:Putative conserved alanine rich transmembrane protein n=1 Tax=Serinibacter arcticus TaxID=1655435 RepID=A0A4Z1E2X2_9MICO|nr:DUF3093 domain-containing protein [Serinibacter arcticus]TGO04813.1 putative conserved alanine rich transmembrane protein [Serinibacter arcticus]